MTDRIRIDKWLWHARFYKTRALAQHAATSGRIRRNDVRVEKAGLEVKIGDILTLGRGREIVVVRILACGIRRGPASEAQTLYETLLERARQRGSISAAGKLRPALAWSSGARTKVAFDHFETEAVQAVREDKQEG